MEPYVVVANKQKGKEGGGRGGGTIQRRVFGGLWSGLSTDAGGLRIRWLLIDETNEFIGITKYKDIQDIMSCPQSK